MKGSLLAWVLFLAVLVPLGAEGQKAPFRSVRCTEQGGVLAYDAQRPILIPDTTSYVYDAIDLEANRARLIEGRGARSVHAELVGGAIHLMEASQPGDLFFATIFLTPRSDGTYTFVHSRHGLIAPPLDDTPVVTQHYGTCRVLQGSGGADR